MAELVILISARTKPGKRDALKTLWEAHLKQRAADNPSQSSYIYAYDMHDENLIHITEVYETMQGFEANSKAEWFEAYMNEARSLLDGEPDFHMAEPKWIK